jgi:hypothetical protein
MALSTNPASNALLSASLQSVCKGSSLTTLSIYSLRGDSLERVRLLYMNATALRIWTDMGQAAD